MSLSGNRPLAAAAAGTTDPAPPLLAVDRVSKQFMGENGELSVLQPLNFQIARGEFICLLGPSGSGKSTLLRILGGLLAPDAGEVRFTGERLEGPRDEIGFVFQAHNLMPWRTALQNALLPVEVQRKRIRPEDEVQARALLALVGLEGFEDAYPRHLSGGMQQRVVLARALIQDPHLLLLDEPFGALDALTRERLNLELLHIHSLRGKTIFMVTHDIPEAVFLADRVLVLSERPGRLVADIPIDLPRPRRLEITGSEHFARLTLEVRRHIGYLRGDERGREA